MGGQDQQRFDEGEKQRRDNDQRDDPHHLAGIALDGDQGGERGDGRENRKDHRHADLPGTFHGGFHGRLPHLQMAVDVLPHDDGVVDHDAQDDDEGEKGDEADRHPHQGHHPQSPQERNRDTQGDPTGEAQLEE